MNKEQLAKIKDQREISNEQRQEAHRVAHTIGLQTATLFFALFYLLIAPCSLFSENEFSFRIAPAIEIPLNIPEFSTGMGADASLDWAFQTIALPQFGGDFSFGAAAGGSFSSLPFETGDPFTVFGGSIGAFLRYRPRIKDTNDRLAFRIAANGGVYQYARNDSKETNPFFAPALGAEFYLSPYFSLFADAVYTYRVFSSEPLHTFSAALGLRLNLSEIMGGRSRVRVEKNRQYSIFPVSYAWYENNPVAVVTVTNDEPNAITDVRLSFYMDSFMSQPWAFTVVPRLASGETVDVDVTALFNEAMLNLNEAVNANGLLQTQYRSLGAKKQSASSIQMPIFNRNTLSWDDDRRAAAFVSPADFSARVFARYVESAVNRGKSQNSGQQQLVPSNVRYAAALFESLRLYGINYIIDPSSSYSALVDDASANDSLNYPYETLKYRGGDCDDLSILLCSLLEALNVETAFITIPGHIYTAFNVGDDNWKKDSKDIIELNGSDGIRRRWLPVEITVPGEGFTRAWHIGAGEWRRSGEEASLYPIRAAWELYPPVTVPASTDHPPEMPEAADIIRALEAELRKQ